MLSETVRNADLIDVHTHFMPPDLPDLAGQTGDGRWPRLVPGNGEHGDIMCGSSHFRRVRRSCWNVPARLAGMDDLGVAAQVVSPVPISLTYWAEPALAVEFARVQNDLLAVAVDAGKGRLIGLGGVALQDVAQAIDEMHRVTRELGLAGVEIGTTVSGEELDSPRLRPFFIEAARAGVPLFVHPVDRDGASRCTSEVGTFGIGMLADTAVAAHALISGGVLEEAPGLRICLSHGGGAYPVAHHRLRYMTGVLAGADKETERSKMDLLAGRLWSDALVFDAGTVEVAAALFGPSHLMIGSDFPFVDFREATDAAFRAGVPGSAADNARRFLFGEGSEA